MRRGIVIGVVAILSLAAGVAIDRILLSRSQSRLAAPTAEGSGPAPADGQPGSLVGEWPTKDEFFTFMEGKTIPLDVKSGSTQENNQPDAVTFARVRVEALEFGYGSMSIPDGWWSTPANIVLAEDGSRCFVQLRVTHKRIEGKRFIQRFIVDSVSRQ